MEFFAPTDVVVIASIPRSTKRHDDFVAWQFEERGLFSAYIILSLWFLSICFFF